MERQINERLKNISEHEPTGKITETHEIPDRQFLTRGFVMFKQLILWLFLPVVTIAGSSVSQAEYEPSKVVYDVSSPHPADLKNVLDRVGLLEKIYNNDSFEASIVLVIHEGAIPLFY